MNMDYQYSSRGKGHVLRGRGLPPGPQSRQQQNYVNYQPPRPDQHLPYLDNALLAAKHYWTTLSDFDQHVKIYLTRYYDFYLEKAWFSDAKAVSGSAVRELAEKLVPHQPPDEAALRRAAVILLCENYTRCEMPESSAARESLLGWAKYINAHLNLKNKKLPEQGQQEYQKGLAVQADSTADALWDAYREFHRDPMKWGNEWAWQEKQRVQRQLEVAGDAAHRIWKQKNYPELIEPAPPIPKLRPEACEFFPKEFSSLHRKPNSPLMEGSTSTDSGYASPSGSSVQQDPPQKPTAQAPDKSPNFISLEEFGLEDLVPVDGVLDNGTTSTGCEDNPDQQQSHLDRKSASVNPPIIPGSKDPSWGDALDLKQRYNHTILMFTTRKEQIPMSALFDSGARGPNWVSREVVQKLGKEVAIFSLENELTFVAADGQEFRAQGAVELAWIFPDPNNKYGHIKWRHETFNVLPSNHIQVMFGADYCRENRLLLFNEQAIHGAEVTPLTPNGKPSDVLKQEMADEKKRLDERRKAAEEQRIKAEKKLEAAKRGS